MAAPDRARALATAVRDGWDTAWIRTDHDVRAVLDGCRFDAEAADHVVEFFGHLRHSKGEQAGQVFVLLPWQDDALRVMFGWMRDDGTRRYRRGGIWIPKKQGKTTLMAGILLYMLIGDGEAGANVYSVANDRDQAGMIYDEAATMVRQSPELRKRLHPVDSRKTIAYPGMAAMLKALSSDVPTKEGLNAHAVAYDELHAARHRDLWDTFAYSGAARRQPYNLVISTAGVYDEASIGWEQYQYAKGVLDGSIEDWAFFALVYEAGKDDDWTAEATWRKANPSYGVTVDAKTFAEECAAARRDPRAENNFRRYRLNQWVNQVTRWIPLATWDENDAHPVDESALAGRICDAGLDLGSVSDLSALALLFPCQEDPEALDVVMRFWIPEAALDAQEQPGQTRRRNARRNPNADNYRRWVKAGLLRITPGNATDYDFIEAEIRELMETFGIRSLGMDRLFQGIQLEIRLKDAGLETFPVGQGFTGQAAPMKEFERKWRSGKIHHGGHPVLRWMADNVKAIADPAGNLKIAKLRDANDSRKVDGIQAIVNAIDRSIRYADAGNGPNWWEKGIALV